MGEVYRAYDDRLKRPLAIKKILADKAADTHHRQRFRREAQAAAGLSHSAIVQIYDIVESDDGDWIVMELIEGTSLRALLEKGSLDMSLALRLAREIVGGLVEAHARGIVHRDLKTENVMVTPTGHAKILDFGLAKQLRPDHQDPTLSAQDAIIGTVRSMSPEQAMGLPIDARSDLFSLGTLLYETVTGESPFYKSNAATTLTRVCTMQQTPARQVNPGVPLGLSDLIERLLEKEPDDRPQTAEEVATELDRLTLDGSEATAAVPRMSVSQLKPVSAGATASLRNVSAAGSEMLVKTLVMSELVAGNPRLTEAGDPTAATLVHRHDRLVRDLLAEHGGIEIDKPGGFLMLFERPFAAVGWAVDYHDALDRLSREEEVELRARVGIHVGEVMVLRNPHRDVARGARPLEVEGLAKPMVARLMALAQGGQTLISRGVYDMARRGATEVEDLEQLSWVGHGSFLFEGIDSGVEVFEVGRDGLAPLTLPPSSEHATRVDGPILQTGELLFRRQRAGRRLLAAVLLLALVAGFFAWRQMGPAEARARPSVSVLGFKNSSGKADLAWLSTAFSEMLRTELAAGGQLRIVSGESVARMKADLDLPETDTLATDTLEKIRRHLGTDYVVLGSYLALGAEGARTVRLDFRLQDAGRGATVTASSERGTEADLFAIVARAGTHLRSEMGLELPAAREADAARASISSSREATALYARALNELRGYRALAARDLLQQAIEVDPGYALAHAVLSEAWLKLGYDQKAEASGKQAFELAKEKDLPREAVLAIEGRYHEAATNWQQAIDTYQLLWDFFPDNLDYGLRLAEVQRREGRDRAALATVDRLRSLPEPVRVDVRIDLIEGAVAYHLGEYRRAREIAEGAVRKARQTNAKVFLAQALSLWSDTLAILGGIAEAEAAFEESRALFLEVGDQASAANVLDSRASLLYGQGDLSGAADAYREALSFQRSIGARKGASTALNNLAGASRLRGDLAEALELLEESLAIARELGDLRRVPTRLNHLGMVYLAQGDLEKAGEMARRARAAQEGYGSQQGIAWDQYLSGEIAFARGDLDAAQTYYQEALRITQAIGSQNLEGRTLSVLGELFLARGDLRAAGERLDAAEAIQAERNERGRRAETSLVRALLLLEQQQRQQAERLTRAALAEFAREDRTDDAIGAAGVLARILHAQGRLAEAREAFVGAQSRARSSQNPAVRLTAEITGARLASAAGEHAAARQAVEGLRDEAAQLGMTGLELEIRLASAELEIASGAVESGAPALAQVARDAEQQGFGLIAGKARKRISRLAE